MVLEYAKSADVADVCLRHSPVTKFTGNSKMQTLCRRLQKYIDIRLFKQAY